MAGHELQDRTSLALARAIASRLRADPSLVQIARQNLANWSRRNADAPGLLRCYAEWGGIIDAGMDATLHALEREDEEGQRLRQSNPFPGVLSAREVWEIKRRCRDDSRAA
jgi:hypothetical protein